MRSAITLLWEMFWEICKYKKVPSLCLIKKSSCQLILHHHFTICICNFLQLVGPYGLFYLNSKGNLMPVAIKLMPEPAKDNPVSYQKSLNCCIRYFSIMILLRTLLFTFTLTPTPKIVHVCICQ